MKVDLKGFHVLTADRETGNMQCGASITASYMVGAGNTETTSSVLEFHLVNGESGQNVIMNRPIFVGMLHDINLKVNAKKSVK